MDDEGETLSLRESQVEALLTTGRVWAVRLWSMQRWTGRRWVRDALGSLEDDGFLGVVREGVVVRFVGCA